MVDRMLQIQSSCSNKPYPVRKICLVSHPILPQSMENKRVLMVVLGLYPQLQWPGYMFTALWGSGLEICIHGGVLLGFREFELELEV